MLGISTPARRRRRPARLLRPVRAPAPRPGGGRHRRQRRPPGPGPQAARARLQRVHQRHAQAADRLPRHRPHPVLDDRVEQRAQHPAVPRRDDARPAGPRPQRQHRQHAGAARGAARPGLRPDRDQRLRGDDADARRRRRTHRGRSASSARCRRGRAPSRSCCWPPTGSSPCATRGASGRCRSGASPTAGTPWPARPARCRRSAASRSPRSQPGEIVTLQGAELQRRQALAPAARQARCTFEFVYFSRPDSVWAGRNVHHVARAARRRAGRRVAASTPTS